MDSSVNEFWCSNMEKIFIIISNNIILKQHNQVSHLSNLCDFKNANWIGIEWEINDRLATLQQKTLPDT